MFAAVCIYSLSVNTGSRVRRRVPGVLPGDNGPPRTVAHDFGIILVIRLCGDCNTVSCPERISVCPDPLGINVNAAYGKVSHVIPDDDGAAGTVAHKFGIRLIIRGLTYG